MSPSWGNLGCEVRRNLDQFPFYHPSGASWRVERWASLDAAYVILQIESSALPAGRSRCGGALLMYQGHLRSRLA